MKKYSFVGLLVLTIVVSLIMYAPPAFAVSWTNWTSITTGTSGSGSGTMTFGSETVNVALSGTVNSFEDGDYYYNNYYTGYTSPTGTYGGLAPSDMIREIAAGSVTINFSTPVVDPYIALVSVSNYSYDVYYTFTNLQNTIEVFSYGSNYWGFANDYHISGNSFYAEEFNGVLKLSGTYSSLTFSFSPYENWHGFNIGAASAAVPEPTSLLLLGLGLVGLAGIRRKM